MTTYKPVEAPTITIRLDPNGRWSSYRFEFCNALEAVAESNSPENREALERLGVHVDAIGKPTINYLRPKGTTLDQIRDHLRSSPLYTMGDCILVWVNEGDFWMNLPHEVTRVLDENGQERSSIVMGKPHG